MGKKDDRYEAVTGKTARNIPVYVVIDTATGKQAAEYDCPLWAESKAKELNSISAEETE